MNSTGVWFEGVFVCVDGCEAIVVVGCDNARVELRVEAALLVLEVCGVDGVGAAVVGVVVVVVVTMVLFVGIALVCSCVTSGGFNVVFWVLSLVAFVSGEETDMLYRNFDGDTRGKEKRNFPRDKRLWVTVGRE